MTRAFVVLVARWPSCGPPRRKPKPPRPTRRPAILESMSTGDGSGRFGQQASAPAGSRRAGSGGARSSLSPALRARLERQGADGKALANAIDATSSDTAPSKELVLPKGAVGDDDGGGIGLVLPAILIAVLLTAILAVLLRRRATS